MKRSLILFVNLMVVWLLLSGHYNATLITYGEMFMGEKPPGVTPQNTMLDRRMRVVLGVS